MQLVDAHLRSEPRAALASLNGVPETILALLECTHACLACADACTSEPARIPMWRCLRLSLDCAAICGATTSVLSRTVEPDWRVVGAQLQTCIIACDATADACDDHSLDHAHCRIAAETCRTTARVCSRLMSTIPTPPATPPSEYP